MLVYLICCFFIVSIYRKRKYTHNLTICFGHLILLYHDYHAHISNNCLYLLIFFNRLEMVKLILAYHTNKLQHISIWLWWSPLTSPFARILTFTNKLHMLIELTKCISCIPWKIDKKKPRSIKYFYFFIFYSPQKLTNTYIFV